MNPELLASAPITTSLEESKRIVTLANRKTLLNVALDEVSLSLDKFNKTFGTGTSAEYFAREELKDARDFLKSVI